MGSPELTVGRVWLALWPAANPGALPERFCVRAGCSKPAVGGVEWLGISLRQRNFENDGLRSGKKCNVMMLRSGLLLFFYFFFEWGGGGGVIWENDMLRSGNLGLKVGVSRCY